MAKRKNEDAPTYSPRYQAQIDALAGELLQRAPFSYDYAADPAWQAYKKEYVREGRRATQDTLGQYAARTGGSPSTAAVTAAQQAGDYYAAQLTDKLPELYRLAYQMYSGETAGKQRTLSELRALEDAAREAWQAELKQWNADRDYDYRLERDAAADARYADETAYQRSRDAAAAEEKARKASGSGGGSTGGSGGGADKWAAVEAWAGTYGYDKAEDYVREHYRDLGYSSQSAALAGWSNHLTEQAYQQRQQASQSPAAVKVTDGPRFRLYTPGPAAGPLADTSRGAAAMSSKPDLGKEAQALERRFASEKDSEAWRRSVLSAYETGLLRRDELDWLLGLA